MSVDINTAEIGERTHRAIRSIDLRILYWNCHSVFCVILENAEDEPPEVVLVLKKWYPLPNGFYHLKSVFYINNYIQDITIPQGRSVGIVDAHVKVSFTFYAQSSVCLIHAHKMHCGQWLLRYCC